MKLSFVDRWVIGYSVAMSAAAVVWGADPLAFRASHLFHAAAVAVALIIARWVPSRGRFWPFIRYGYPMILLGLFYRDTGPYVFLFFDTWFDPQLLAWEQSVFGFNIPAAIASVKAVWVMELWMFGYVFYYVMMPLAAIVAVWKNRPDRFRQFAEAAVIVFFVSFAMFSLFPLEGPRHALLTTLPPIEGGVFFGWVMTVQNAGSIHGGCMPSSHTALAWVATWYVFGMHRGTGMVLTVISTLLTVGCFWGRFHYVTDVLVGLALFAVAVAYTSWRNRGVQMQAEVLQTKSAPCIQ